MCYAYSEMSILSFELDPRTGVPAYLQIVQQVKRALRLGVLEVGDQLPTVREVVATIAINPNTVLKAYRDLEHEGLVATQPGRGTFVQRTLRVGAPPAALAVLRRDLEGWIARARDAGLDSESVLDLLQSTFRDADQSRERSA